MLAFSLGLGAPFFVVGTFAIHLPKSGRWMLHVKSTLAIVLAIVGLYFLSTAFPQLVSWVVRTPTTIAVCASAIVIGGALGGVHRDFGSPLLEEKALKSLGASSMTLGGLVLITALTIPERALEWLHLPLKEAQTLAAKEQRPLLVDFTAKWCGACKELDAVTFSDPKVARETARFVRLKIDATNDEDPQVQAAMESLKVIGLPTVVVLNRSGTEATRFTDFVGPDGFLKALKAVR